MSNLYKTKYQEDVRGFIKRHDDVGVHYATVYTRKGSYRGGEIHPCDQSHFILKGSFEITIINKETKKEETFVLSEGEHHLMPKGTPHLFHALEDTLMIDTYHGNFNPTTYYEPFRKLVREQFEK